MALNYNMHGWELGDREDVQSWSGGDSSIMVVGDGTARTGDFFARLYHPTATAGGNTQDTYAVDHAPASLPEGSTIKGMARAFVRIKTAPSATVRAFGFGATTGGAVASVTLDSSRRAGINILTGSTQAGTFAMALDTWYRIEITSVLTNRVAPTPDTLEVTVHVYSEDGATLHDTITLSGQPSLQWPQPTIGDSTVSASRMIDIDDWLWITGDRSDAASVALPAATRITRVEPTGTGASNGFTGAWQSVRKYHSILAPEMQGVSAGSNVDQTFVKDTAANLGLSGIAWVKMYACTKSSVIGTDALLIAGTEYTFSHNNSGYSATTVRGAIDRTGYSNAAFDAIEFGVRNKHASTFSVCMAALEVLHAGSDLVRPVDPVGTFNSKCGTYVGTGTVQDIAGVGFRPQVLIVKKTNGTGNSHGAFRVHVMGGTYSKRFDVAARQANCIQAFGADGFTLGTDDSVNQSGTTYQYIALQDGGAHPTDGYFMRSGVALGSGVDNQDVTIGAAWQPDFVLLGGFTSGSFFRTSDNSGDQSAPLLASGTLTNQIQGFNADGFQLGTTCNARGAQAPFLAFRFGSSGRLETLFQFGAFTAAASTHTVTGMPFEPEFVAGKRHAVIDARWRGNSVHAGTNSLPWGSIVSDGVGFTSITSDGFTVGTALASSGQVTQWFAFKTGTAGEFPVLTCSGTDLAFTEDDGATAIDPGLTITDVDSPNLSGAEVTISANFASGEDVLAFVDQNGITGSWNAGTGVLTLSGTASVAHYQAALRSVTFDTDNVSPSLVPRTITFEVTDDVGLASSDSRDITVALRNDPPIVTADPAALAYTEGDGAVVIDATITVADEDDTNIEWATVQITGNYARGEDQLAFVDQLGIVGAWDEATGTLTLTGSAPLADYQTALRSVTYENLHDGVPVSQLPRTLTITVSDT